MPDHDDSDDFWADEGADRPSRRAAHNGGNTSRKALPIVAAAAALLLIVVIFIVARSGSSKKETSASTTAVATDSHVATSTSTAPTSTQNRQASWTGMLLGAPATFRGAQGSAQTQPNGSAQPGVYFWEDYSGWHLRVVPGNGLNVVKGTVTGRAPSKVDNVTGADAGVATVDGGNVNFNINASAPVAVDFTLGFYTNTALLTLNGSNGPIETSKVYLGGTGTSPTSLPVTFEKK